MEIEFNGITANKLQEICDDRGITSEILPLASRDTICPREDVRTFGDGTSYYLVEESCWHGYYFCGAFNCGRSSRVASRRTAMIQPKSSKKPGSGRTSNICESARCFEGGSCDTGSDSSGAFIIFFLIIAIFMLLIFLAPVLGPLVALGIELGLAFMLVIFDLLTFGIFRKKFKRVLIYFPTSPSDEQLKHVIGDAATFGGLPRRFHPEYGTNGFWLLRTGAYLFLPSLVATLLVLWLQPTNGFLFRVPIVSLTFSILFVWFGNYIINRKARFVAQTV